MHTTQHMGRMNTHAGHTSAGMLMPGGHPRPPRTGLGSRERMMHHLLRSTGGTEFFPAESKIQLAEQLSQVTN